MVFLFIHPLWEQVSLYRRHLPAGVVVEHASDMSFLGTSDCRRLLETDLKPLVCLHAAEQDYSFFPKLRASRLLLPETRFSVLAETLDAHFLDQCSALGVGQCINYTQYRPRQVAELLYANHLSY
jgi:hypothetical protein